MVKDIDEQPGEEVCKTKSGRVLSTGASVPVAFRMRQFPVGACLFVSLEAVSSPNPVLLGFYRRLIT